jgi:hypothetical protein
MKKLPLIVAAFALTLMAGIAASAQTPPEKRVDHFRCYPVEAPGMEVKVQLEDQFDVALKKPETVTTLRAAHLCNPVQKTVKDVNTPIVKPTHHLLMYTINQQPVVERRALIKNQFGEQTLTLSAATTLAVPTGKAKAPGRAPKPPDDLDHYKCYEASGLPLKELTAGLKDQFLDEKVQVLKPVSFCNPVRKKHGNITTKIQNADVHLACYVTSPSAFKGAKVNTLNQFGPREFGVRPADMLCVPSLKLKWSAAGGKPAGGD